MCIYIQSYVCACVNTYTYTYVYIYVYISTLDAFLIRDPVSVSVAGICFFPSRKFLQKATPQKSTTKWPCYAWESQGREESADQPARNCFSKRHQKARPMLERATHTDAARTG